MANYSLGEARGRITIDYDGGWAQQATAGVENFRKTVETTTSSNKKMFESVGGWTGIGSLATGVGKKLTLGLTTPAVAAGTALGALTIGPGLDRLISIDNAQAKLKGLGHDAGSVQQIMDNALASVKGTAFGLGEAATVAANAVAAGVKPGADLERTLRLTADAATIAGVGMGEMGAVFNKVAASNKVQMDVINQLHDAGVPALALLADQMGVTAEEASKMASEGAIDFATFQAAMEKGMGGAALESGATFEGAMANMRAAMGRFGAELLGEILPMVQEAFGRIMEAFDKLKPLATQLGAAITPVLSAILDGVIKLAEWFANLSPEMQSAIMGAVAVGAAVGPALMIIGKAFSLVGAAIATVTAIKSGYAAATYGLVAANNAERVGVLASNAAMIAKKTAVLAVTAAQKVAAAATIAWTEITKGAAVAAWLMQPANAAAAASLIAQKTALIATTAVQKTATAAQWLWNAALTANPIGIVIAAVTALVAAIIWFFTQTDLGREIWANFMTWLQEAWTNIASFFTTLWQGIVEVFTNVWNGIQAVVGAVVDWFQAYVWPIIQFVIDMIIAYFQMYWTVVSTIWNGVMAVVGAVVDWFMTHVWPTIQAVIDFIVKLFNYFSSVVAFVWDAIWSAINSAVSAIVSFLTTIWTEFSNFWKDIWNAVSSFVQTVWTAIWNFLKPIITNIWNFISDVFTNVWNFIKTVFTNVWNFIQDVWNNISNVVSTVVNAVWGFISGTWNQIVGFVTGVFNNVKKAITDPIEDALDFIGGIKDKIMGFMAGAGDWLFNIGKDIIGGFIRGLESMFAEVGNFFRDLTNMIPETKGPPEKDKVLLTDNGKLIMRSLYNGLQAEMGDVMKLMGGMNATIPATLNQDILANVGTLRSDGGSEGKAQVVINFTYNASEGDPLDEQKVISMLGHATELVREELS